ncbi:hypothetical protein IGI49_000506 [Enterococcus sp. AZ071]
MTISFCIGWLLVGIIDFVLYKIMKRTKSTLLWLLVNGLILFLSLVFCIGSFIILRFIIK